MTHQNIQSPENLGGAKSSLTFGDFQTQICGAMSMGLLQSQSEIARTGAKMATEFTSEQKASYKGQSVFLIDGYNVSVDAAIDQAEQMRIGAGGEFANAGFGLVGTLGMVREGRWSETSKKLDNVSDKLTQQEKLLQLAHEKAPKLTGVAINQTPPLSTPATYKEEVIRNRRAQLVAEGAGTPRELASTVPTSRVSRDSAPLSEKSLFPQGEYKRDAGKYYNEGATDEQVSKRTATRGAYHIDGLDEEAIEGMNPQEHADFVKQLNESIKSTKVEQNGCQLELQRVTQMIGEGLQIAKSCTSGGSQLWQSYPQAQSKKDEAQATLANNSGGIAGGIAQNANQAKEGALSTAQNAMQSFGRVYDGMRA